MKVVKMKKLREMRNKLLILLSCLLFVSCKQTIYIQKQILNNTANAEVDLGRFLQDSLFDCSFWIGSIFCLIMAVVIWKWGYVILMGFKRQSLFHKVVTLLVIIALMFGLGNIPFHLSALNYGIWFALPVMVLLVSTYIVIAAIVNLFKISSDCGREDLSVPETYKRQRNLWLMAKIVLWVWSFGWVVYFVAISVAKQPHVGSEVLLRSAICSLQLFAANMDSNIVDDIETLELLKGLLSSVCFAATICTAIVIMSLVMYRLVAYLHIRHLAINSKRNHIYVFFGMNHASDILAKDICSEHGDPNGVVIFVETNLASEAEKDEERADGWKSLLNMLTHRRKTFLNVPDDDRHALAIAGCSLCSIDDETNNVWDTIGLTTVRQSLESLKSVKDAELHIFLLSEDGDTNARSVPILVKDSLVTCPDFQTTIYCHARRNTINRIIEDLGLSKNLRTEVKILDSSYLAIEQLKREVKNQPVSFVSVRNLNDENPGAVSSEFVSLVMGFGETGQEAVKFLYEYGAFVNENASEQNSYRSPFSCYVLDRDLKNLEGHFISGKPGVLCKKCNENRSYPLIKFYSIDFRSDEFFSEILDNIAEKLNYVVIAIGDDEQNMTVAVEILRYMRKKRANFDNFCIYVRAYEKGSFRHLAEIAKHYNMRIKKNESDTTEPIVLFGQSEDIYTYELVVKDKFREDGRQYYETYRSLQIDPSNDEGLWEERHQNNMKPDKKGRTTKWDRMSKIRRKESQDRSNALHAQTKIMLLQKAVGEENAKDFALRALDKRTGHQTGITYPLLSPAENKLMLNLAMCEHLRWNAAHEMLGYVNNENEHECNERTRQHNCLKPWQDLDKETDAVDYIKDYKLFDFGVVETSFKLNYKPENH